MQTRQLGATGLEISRIGFGAWAAGGTKWRQGWSGQDDRDSREAIERALDLGINWIDTAPAYGWGHSESIVGETLRQLDHRPLLFTKCSALKAADGSVTFSLDQDSLRRELESSLNRLETDSIDLYQLHRPLPEPDIERGWETIVSFRAEGLVRHIGVSNFTVPQLRRIGVIAPVETIQPPYSLMQPEAGVELLPFAETNGIGVIVYSPMGSGLLTGRMTQQRFDALPTNDWRKNDARFAPDKLARSFELIPRLRAVADGLDGAHLGSVAIAWTLRHPAVDGAIVGFRNASQVEELVGADELNLNDEVAAALTA
jgi:aryl-alcohol dehydrogenase-like predicted oxidoreductase